MLLLLSYIWLVTVIGYFVTRTWKHGLINPSGYIPSWWPYGHNGWLAYCRFVPSAYLAIVVGGAGLFAPYPLDIVGISLTVVGSFAAWSTVLINRPRFLVPPARRSDLGILTEWLERRADKRAG